MRWILSLAVCVSLISSAAQAQQTDNLIFSASRILPAPVLQTNTYRIADSVLVSEHQFQFNIKTSYGTFPVTGIPMLEKRLSELRAIEEAGKLGNQAVAVKGAWATLKRTPQGAEHLLADPLGTLKQAPRGIKKMAANFIDPVSRHAGSDSRRKLAANLGVDSETRNPVLKQMLIQLAAREMVGQSATKFALSAAIPGLGTLSSMENLRDTVAAKSPHELLGQMDAELTQLGSWGPVKDSFIKSSNWTILEKLTFMQSYKRLVGVEHADLLLYLANRDGSEAEILRRLITVKLLAELHAKNPIQSLSEAGLPVAWLRDGQVVGVCSIDYLTNSAEVQQVAKGFRQSNPTKTISLLSAGWVSPEAQKTLTENRITFVRADFAANAKIAGQSNNSQESRR